MSIRWQQLHQAVRVLRGGGVIAYPAEGVRGRGCDPANADAVARVLESWPGAVTWVVPAPRWVPCRMRGDSSGVAIRVSAHAQTAALWQAFGGALVSTSANRAGRARFEGKAGDAP